METAQPFKKTRMRHRPGFETRAMRWTYRVLYPFFHCRVNIPKELADSEEPVVFIANHYNCFGPVSFVISVPLVSNIWINEELVKPEMAAEAFLPGTKKLFPFFTEHQAERFSRWIGGIAVRALNRFGMIPVNRNKPSTLISTMRKSIQALEEGHNLLIFPEVGLPEYSLTSVTPFFPGFATLGRLYHRKTGKRLWFCPCYIDEQHRQIHFCDMVTYDPEAENPAEETERVSEECNLRIREKAAKTRGVEKEEKSTPLFRSILFFCNLLRALLLIPLVTMLGIDNHRMILLFYALSEGLRILFNAVWSLAYSASNRMSYLFSHGLGILTDMSMLIYLAARAPQLRWLLYAVILNGIVILISNILTFFRYRRCAGVNYFDTVCANLLFAIILQQLLRIRLSPLVMGGLTLAAMVFLACSAGSAVAFNARIGREEAWDTEAQAAD